MIRPRILVRGLIGLLGFAFLVTQLSADNALRAYKALGYEVGDVLNGTVLEAQVRENAGKEFVALVTAFTGKRSNREAVDIELAILKPEGEQFTKVWSKRYQAAVGAPVARGELQLLDFDGDGLQEIVVQYDVAHHPDIRQREGEVLTSTNGSFEVAWTGTLMYDATDASVAEEKREHYFRSIDVPETLKTRGVTLFFRKITLAQQGKKLSSPLQTTETAPFLERTED